MDGLGPDQWLRITIKKQKYFVSGGRTEITEKTSCDALDLPYLWSVSPSGGKPDYKWAYVTLSIDYKPSMKGTPPPPRGAEKGQRQACNSKPGYICRVAGWPAPSWNRWGGGSTGAPPRWRPVQLPRVALARVACTPQGKSQGPRPTQGTRQLTFNVPADLGPPWHRSQWLILIEQDQWF